MDLKKVDCSATLKFPSRLMIPCLGQNGGDLGRGAQREEWGKEGLQSCAGQEVTRRV